MKLNEAQTLELTKVGEEIHRDLACKMVKDYQDIHPADIKSYFIGREIIEKILNQPRCVGIRFYNAINESGEKTLVYVGLDENEEIITEVTYVNESGKILRTPGIVADRVKPGGENGDSSDDDNSISFWS